MSFINAFFLSELFIFLFTIIDLTPFLRSAQDSPSPRREGEVIFFIFKSLSLGRGIDFVELTTPLAGFGLG